MNGAIAWKIAHNHVVRFLEQNKKKEEHEPSFLSLDSAFFDAEENGEDEDPERRSLAFSILYGKKGGRSREGVRTWENQGNDWLKGLQEHGGISGLKKLVDSYYGIKRKVAEALLANPDIGVCDIQASPVLRSAVSSR